MASPKGEFRFCPSIKRNKPNSGPSRSSQLPKPSSRYPGANSSQPPRRRNQLSRLSRTSHPDLKLTISPTPLNTLISSATNPILTPSSIFSAPIGTSMAPAIDAHNFQEPPITDSSLTHFLEYLPAPIPHPLFSSTLPQFSPQTHNPTTHTNIFSSEILGNSNASTNRNSRSMYLPQEYSMPSFS